MNRQLPVRKLFPSIRFIKKGKIFQHGKKGLSDILLLVLRLLCLALLILAFAVPIFKISKGNLFSADQILIFCDASVSMKRFGRKKVINQVEKITKKYNKSIIGVIISSNKVLSCKLSSPDDALSFVKKNYEISNASGLHSLALAKIPEILKWNTVKKIIVVSDFQTTDWDANKFTKLDINAKTEFYNLMDNFEEYENVSIQNAEIIQNLEQRNMLVTIKNFSNKKQAVSLSCAEILGNIQLSPQETSQIILDLKDVQTSELCVKLKKKDDYLADNSYYVWGGLKKPINIMFFVPFLHEPQKKTELFFIKKSLEIQDQNNRQLLFEQEDADMFFSVNLLNYDAIFFLGAGGYLHKDGLKRIKNFLEEGGLLISTPGDKFQSFVFSLNKLKMISERYIGLKDTLNNNSLPYYIGLSENKNRITNLFKGTREKEFLEFPVFKYFKLNNTVKKNTVLLFDNNDPALLHYSLGRGTFFLWTSALTSSWSDFPISTSFLPIMHAQLAELSEETSGITEIYCGDSSKNKNINPKLLLKPGVFKINDTPWQVNIDRNESVVEIADLFAIKTILEGKCHVEKQKNLIRKERNKNDTKLWLYFIATALIIYILTMIVESLKISESVSQ